MPDKSTPTPVSETPPRWTVRIHYRVPSDDLLDQLRARAVPPLSIDLVARRDLERYYACVHAELRTVSLTIAEACLTCDACNGIVWLPATIPSLPEEIEKAIRQDSLDEKWAVDGSALVARLQTLSYGQKAAIADAIERFWRLVTLGDHEPTERLLRRVGLIHI